MQLRRLPLVFILLLPTGCNSCDETIEINQEREFIMRHECAHQIVALALHEIELPPSASNVSVLSEPFKQDSRCYLIFTTNQQEASALLDRLSDEFGTKVTDSPDQQIAVRYERSEFMPPEFPWHPLDLKTGLFLRSGSSTVAAYDADTHTFFISR